MEFSESDIKVLLDRNYDTSLAPESPYPEKLFKTGLYPAAVLIPFLQMDKEWHLLFIRRTYQKNDRHGGQVAFPGGRSDPGDPDAESTALREAKEETGILPNDVRLLGRLQDMVTITGYRVTPIVGVIPWPYTLTPQYEEVDKIFTIPLIWLANSGNREVREREILVKGRSTPVIYYHAYNGEILWGASARITMLLLESLGLSTPGERYYAAS